MEVSRLLLFAINMLFCMILMNHVLPLQAENEKDDIKPVSFIFGDSLSDVGNNKYLSRSLARSDYPWYGIDFGNGVPTGRFTNGRTISDIVADKMGLPSPAAYLDPSTNVDVVLKQGVNYASGGGGILNETGWLFIQRISLSRQIAMFQGTKEMVVQKIGRDKAEKFFNQSVYLMGIGSNDFINNYLFPIAADAWKFGPEDFIDYLMISLRQQLIALHSLGVRNLVFIGLGPLGCIPLQRVTTSDGGCRQNLNSWSLKFNSASNNLIKDLNSKLPAAQFKFADGYSFFNDIIQNPKNYGFEVSDTPCCTLGRYRPTLSCVPAAKLCSNRSKYVFWDEYHPSDAANHIIASALMAAMDLKPGASSPPPSASPPSTGFSPSPSPSS